MPESLPSPRLSSLGQVAGWVRVWLETSLPCAPAFSSLRTASRSFRFVSRRIDLVLRDLGRHAAPGEAADLGTTANMAPSLAQGFAQVAVLKGRRQNGELFGERACQIDAQRGFTLPGSGLKVGGEVLGSNYAASRCRMLPGQEKVSSRSIASSEIW